MSVEVGYFRRWFQNFFVQENRVARRAADFTQFSSRAVGSPPAGRRRLRGRGLYNVTPDGVLRATEQLHHDADNYGGQSQLYNGAALNVSARPRNGLTCRAASTPARR